jgi:hypothetical protein
VSVNQTPNDIVTEERPESVDTGRDLTEEPSVEFGFLEIAGPKLPPPTGDVVPPSPDRPQIRIADGDLPEILSVAEKVIARRCYKRVLAVG